MKLFIIFFVLISTFSSGQNNLKNLRGNVTDLDKNPLQGVIVILKNESKFEYRKETKPDSGDIIVPAMSDGPLSFYAGGETNIYGDYNFPVSLGEHVLEISFPGLKTIVDTILVTENSWDVHNYQLEQDYFDLGELAVNVPYTYSDSNYIKPGEEFRYSIRINNMPVPYKFNFQCRFISHTGTSYNFEIDSFKKGLMSLEIYPNSFPLKLNLNDTYEIKGGFFLGYPSAFGLFIKKDSIYLFGGLSAYKLNEIINLPKDFPIQINLVKTLETNYLIDGSFIYNNILYSYNLDNKTILLNQNESGTLDDYFIYQGIARSRELNGPGQIVCDDSIVIGISFAIVRK